jgi:chloramphenicol 3-O-phosphotransferase
MDDPFLIAGLVLTSDSDPFRKSTMLASLRASTRLGSSSLAAIARVILLNGPGSAGKSSIAKALQAMTVESFLHVSMDTFLEMLPEKYSNHPDTFTYRIDSEDGKPTIVIETGPAGEANLNLTV